MLGSTGILGARRGTSPAPSRDSSGMVAMVRAVTNSNTWAVSDASKCSPLATETMTKANSPPGPSSKPACRLCAQFSPKARANPVTTSSFKSTTQAIAVETRKGHVPKVRMSRLIPTEIRKTPTARPLNGSIVTST